MSGKIGIIMKGKRNYNMTRDYIMSWLKSEDCKNSIYNLVIP